MSTTTPPSAPGGYPPGTAVPAKTSEIKLVSHSNLFYWWPVWAFAFFMAAWTGVENHRLAIVPPDGTVTKQDGGYLLRFANGQTTQSLEDAASLSMAQQAGEDIPVFRPRVSHHAGLGAVFTIVLLLTIVITNVPLRGLWSFLAICLVVLVALIISLLGAWDTIFERLSNLHIYINMAGYLFIGTSVFVLWALATFVFDQRSYIIFTPGQIRVCEHIGASVEAIGTTNLRLEKQRDDLFRHYILGFGSGDLIVHAANGREIKFPNVLGIGWRLKTVEDMLRTVSTA